jgi:hypothetical protein
MLSVIDSELDANTHFCTLHYRSHLRSRVSVLQSPFSMCAGERKTEASSAA